MNRWAVRGWLLFAALLALAYGRLDLLRAGMRHVRDAAVRRRRGSGSRRHAPPGDSDQLDLPQNSCSPISPASHSAPPTERQGLGGELLLRQLPGHLPAVESALADVPSDDAPRT